MHKYVFRDVEIMKNFYLISNSCEKGRKRK